MAEASWDESIKTPPIDWSVSAALENVDRGGQDVPEVTNLAGAVRAWLGLDAHHKSQAVLTIEHPIQFDGVATATFECQSIAALADHLPANAPE